jgi:hypothetical protein
VIREIREREQSERAREIRDRVRLELNKREIGDISKKEIRERQGRDQREIIEGS